MKQPKIFYGNKEKTYFIENCSVCDCCKKELVSGDIFFLLSEFGRKIQSHRVLCIDCIKSIKRNGIVNEVKQGFIINSLPESVVPAILVLPQLEAKKKTDIFLASNFETMHTKDKTKFANRVSIQGANIGKYSEFELMRDRELLSDDELEKKLIELKKSRCEDEYK